MQNKRRFMYRFISPQKFLLTGFLTCACLASAVSVSAQTYLFDFGAAGSGVGLGPGPENDPVNHWNNVGAALTADAGSYSNAVTAQNVSSTLSLVVVSRFNGVNEAGTTVSTLYPGNATRDSLFGNTETFNGVSNLFPGFKLTGLDAQTTYSFTFYASRTGVGDNRETGYTVVGATTNFAALDPANNIDNTASVTGLSPDGAGEITIRLAPTENNNNANHFTYLGVLRVDAVPPQTPLAFTQEPASQRALELQPVTFSAAVSGPPPYHIQWLRNGEPIDGATQFNYTIASATLDLDGSLYSVSVSNLAYGVTSSNALLRVVNDTIAPQVLSATARNGQAIELLFNEALDSFTASSPFNYEVNGGNPGVPAAELRPDGKTVVLTLDPPLAPGAAFTVVINEVQDLSLNVIAANTTISGTVPGPEAQVFLIDFGGANTTLNGASPDDPINHWNNLTTAIGATDDGALAGLITADNTATPVNLVMQARFNGANENGTTAAALFPVDATRDSLYGNTETFNNLANIFPKFKLTGLDPALGYTLTFYASRTGVGDNRTTRYTVEGAATAAAELNAANNVTNTVTVPAARPSEGGELTISLAPAAANNNANHFTYLGVLRVQPAVEPPQFTAPRLGGGKIHLEWTGGGVLESAPTVLGPWTPVDGAPASPAALDTSDLAPGHRFFRISK